MKVYPISAKAQNGKDFTAIIIKEVLEQKGERVLIIHYADYLKYLCKEIFNWDGKKDDEGRTILQKVGTNLVRQNNPNCWINVVNETLKGLKTEFDVCLIPDTRFKNEIESLIEYGWDVRCIRCERIGFENSLTEEQRNHPSETELDDYEFDIYLNYGDGKESVIDAIERSGLFD